MMRSQAELQEAHDLLLAILEGDIPLRLDDEDDRSLLHGAADVLCWVLQHAHNTAFARNLEELLEALAKAGFVRTDIH